MLDKSNGYFITALNKTSEPIRTNKWLANFNFNELSNSNAFPKSSILSLHVKEFSVPEFNQETDSMYFFGVERKLPTNTNNTGTSIMTLLEGEDLIVYNSLLRWNQQCINAGQFSEGSGTFSSNIMHDKFPVNSPNYGSGDIVNSNVVSLSCFSYVNGEELFNVSYLNIKPTKVGHVKLTYEAGELYKYEVTFEFDLATLHRNSKSKFKSAIPHQPV